MSSAKHRHYEKTLKSSGKCFIYGKLLRHTSKVSLRFLLRDILHEAFFTGPFLKTYFLRRPQLSKYVSIRPNEMSRKVLQS